MNQELKILFLEKLLNEQQKYVLGLEDWSIDCCNDDAARYQLIEESKIIIEYLKGQIFILIKEV